MLLASFLSKLIKYLFLVSFMVNYKTPSNELLEVGQILTSYLKQWLACITSKWKFYVGTRNEKKMPTVVYENLLNDPTF